MTLEKHEADGYGFTVKGEEPCHIVEVEQASAAEVRAQREKISMLL